MNFKETMEVIITAVINTMLTLIVLLMPISIIVLLLGFIIG
jgi:hypothetical protein